jgi:methionine-rich copper-binding protein CopC
MEQFKYRVVGQNTVIRHNFEDYREGDELELPKHVAVNFKNQLEPLSEEAKFVDTDNDVIRATQNMRDHEREQILRDRKSELETQLDKVDAELEKIEKAKRPAPAEKAGEKVAK